MIKKKKKNKFEWRENKIHEMLIHNSDIYK